MGPDGRHLSVPGALSLPDIGQLSPDSGPEWSEADSSVFMEEAFRRMKQGVQDRQRGRHSHSSKTEGDDRCGQTSCISCAQRQGGSTSRLEHMRKSTLRGRGVPWRAMFLSSWKRAPRCTRILVSYRLGSIVFSVAALFSLLIGEHSSMIAFVTAEGFSSRWSIGLATIILLSPSLSLSFPSLFLSRNGSVCSWFLP